MSLENDIVFRKQLEQSDNIYNSINSVVSSARELANKCDNTILHSKAITCIISGVKPPREYIRDYRDEYEGSIIKELFCYIDDKEICDAVYDSYFKSKSANNLKYVYNSISDESRRTRVRVLTRMLWYSILK